MSRSDQNSLLALTRYYIQAGQYDELTDLIDGGVFFVLKERAYGIETLSEDLENYIIPATIQKRDWNHFSRYVTLDINLKELAERLSQDVILKALVKNGRTEFAHHIINQINDPLNRAVSRSVVLDALNKWKQNEENGSLLFAIQKHLEEDLREAASYYEDGSYPVRWAEALAKILSSINVFGYSIIQPYIYRILGHKGEEFDKFWLTLAKSMGIDYEKYRSEIWDALRHVNSHVLLVAALPYLPILPSSKDWKYALDQLKVLDLPVTFFAESFFILANLLPNNHGIDIWGDFIRAFKDTNDLQFQKILPEHLSGFFNSLTQSQVHELLANTHSLEAQLSILICENTIRPDSIPSFQILKRIDLLETLPVKMHWLLRFLELGGKDVEKTLKQAKRIAFATTFCFHVDTDASAFLNVLARYEPGNLQKYFDLMAFSEGMSTDVLNSIALQCCNAMLLKIFINNIEKYVGGMQTLNGESEKFKCRRKILLLLLYNALRIGDMTSWKNIINNKLFESEQDEIYTVVVQLVEDGLLSEANELAGYLRNPRLRFLASLQLLESRGGYGDSRANELLTFTDLYALFADTALFDDVALFCDILCKHPVDLKASILQSLINFTDNTNKKEALFDGAMEILDYQQETYGIGRIHHQDATELCLKAVGLIQSRDELLDYLPQITNIVTWQKMDKSLDEILEGIKQVIRSEEITYSRKINVILKLLSLFRDLYKDGLHGSLYQQMGPARNFKKLFDTLYLFSQDAEDPYLRGQIERCWHLLFPVMVAVLCECGSQVPLDVLNHSWQANLAYDHLFLITRLSEKNIFFNFLVNLEEKRLSVIFKRINRSPWRSFIKYAQEHLQPENARIISFAKESLDLPVFNLPGEILSGNWIGLAFVYAVKSPFLLPAFLNAIPENDIKDIVIVRIIIDDWIPDRYNESLIPDIVAKLSGKDLTKFVMDWLEVNKPHVVTPTRFLKEETLEFKAAYYAVAKKDSPIFFDIRDWLIDVYRSVKLGYSDFAEQVILSLKQYGTIFGKVAFQQWLTYYLHPRYSIIFHQEKNKKIEDIRNSISLARTLATTPESDQLVATSVLPIKSFQTFDKYKKWRNELPRRLDQYETISEGIANTGIITLLLYSVILLFFDLSLRGGEAVQHYVSMQPMPLIWVGLFVVYIMNIWLVCSLLAQRRTNNIRLRPLAVFLIAIFSGIPIWGLFSFPLHTWILRVKPAWLISKNTGVILAQQGFFDITLFADFLVWTGIRFWKKWGIWWGYLFNLVISFLTVYYFLDTYVPLGFPYQQIGTVLGLFLHFLVFINALAILHYDGRQLELVGWKLWLKYAVALLWLIPIPGFSFIGVVVYLFSSSENERKNTVLFQAFYSLGNLSRDPIWSDLKEKLEVDFKNLGWFRGVREPAYHDVDETRLVQEKIPFNFILKIRGLMAAGFAAWLVWGLFQVGLDIESIDAIMYIIIIGSLCLGTLGLLISITQFVLALKDRRLFLPDPPYFVYLYLSQYAFFSGCIFSYGFATNDYQTAVLFGLIGFVFLGLKFIEIILDTLMNIPKPKKQMKWENIFQILFVVTMVSFVMNADAPVSVTEGMSFTQAVNTLDFKLVELDFLFRTSVPLMALLLVVSCFNRFMSPFGLRNIFNRTLPLKMRLVLVFVGASFVLPFGEMLFPISIYLKEKYWIEFEKLLVD